jgi:hypothetical protein
MRSLRSVGSTIGSAAEVKSSMMIRCSHTLSMILAAIGSRRMQFSSRHTRSGAPSRVLAYKRNYVLSLVASARFASNQRFFASSPRKTKQVERAFATCLPS